MLPLRSAGSFTRAGSIPAALLLLGGCALFGRSNSTLPAHMAVHGAQVGLAQTSIIRGDLEGARKAAQWLAEHEEHPGLPQGVMSPAEDVRAFARGVVRAGSVEDAARSVAEIASACGRCHQAAAAGPTVAAYTMPPSGTMPAPHMLRHIWAADRMWDGLVGPSDRSWELGATGLMEDPLFQDAQAQENPEVRTLAKQVHALGATARTTPPAHRAGVYGRLLLACAQCHAVMGVEPDVGLRQ